MGINTLASHSSSLSKIGGGDINGKRIMYPAIVVPYGTDDSSEQGRIRARIVAVDDKTGEIIGAHNADNKEGIGALENYNGLTGTDRGIPDEDLVMCVPLLPQFFLVTPQVGEMVFLIIENPSDKTSTRYWIGPIISSKLKLPYQGYEDTISIFDKTSFYVNKKIDGSALSVQEIFPSSSDVALQGRFDADLILKKRETLLIAGKMNFDDFTVNTQQPSYLRLKQIDSVERAKNEKIYPDPTHNIITQLIKSGIYYTAKVKVVYKRDNVTMEESDNITSVKSDGIGFVLRKIKEYQNKYQQWQLYTDDEKEFNVLSKLYYTKEKDADDENEKKIIYPFNSYSLAELVSTNILLYSPLGKFRGDNLKDYEISDELRSLGDMADLLHPAVFGDELVKVLDLIIRFLISHVHQPQNPPIETSVSDSIKEYNVKGKLQNLLSNLIRIN